MEFIGMLASIGPWAVCLVLIVVFIIIIREIKKETESITKAMGALQKQTQEATKALEERVATIERDYADKSYVQESVGGWRMEIRALSDRIDSLLLAWGKRKE